MAKLRSSLVVRERNSSKKRKKNRKILRKTAGGCVSGRTETLRRKNLVIYGRRTSLRRTYAVRSCSRAGNEFNPTDVDGHAPWPE